MARSFEIADVVRMIEACAPETTFRIRNHSILAARKGRIVALPRGAGTPRKIHDARGQAYDYQVRKVVTQLELNVTCVERHFPGLWG